MSLFLQVDSNEQYQFYEKFDRLSPLRQRIWRKLIEKSRDYVVHKTNQSKLAKWCGCSRSAISEAFRIFKTYGWMWLQSRGWKRSKIIEIPISKRQMDLDKKSYFHRVQATYRATLTTSTRKSSASTTGSQILGLKIAPHLEKTKFCIKDKLKLSLVAENFYKAGMEAAEEKYNKGKLPSDRIFKYIIGTAISMAKKVGEKINWPSYYHTLKTMGIAA